MSQPKPKREPIAVSSQPSPLPLAGETYLVAKHTLGDRELLEQYARDRTPQPLKELHERARQFDESMYQEIVRAGLAGAMAAQDRWPPRWGTPGFFDAFQTPAGSVYILWVALRRFRPELTLDAVQAIADRAEGAPEVTAEIAAALARFVYGIEVKLTAEDLLDPKPEGGEAAPGTDSGPEPAAAPPATGG